MADTDSRQHPDSFSSSVRILLILGQVCGLLPVEGIFGSGLTFTWRNPFLLYGFFISGVTLFFDICYTIDNLRSTFGIDIFASTVFYSCCLLTYFLFLKIAREFSQISKEFEDVDNLMSSYGHPKRLTSKINLFLYVFVVLAAIEHGTLVCINIASIWSYDVENNEESFTSLFYTLRFSAIERRVPYSGLAFIIFFWSNLMCTFNWNYLDFFLVSFSMQVSERFAQINSNLKSNFHAVNQNSDYFVVIQKHYNKLSILTKKMDDRFGKIILTSFFSNIYHLSLQLNRSLKLNGTLSEKTYFYFSVTYLMTRLLLVLFFASNIHEESKKPGAILCSLKTPCPAAIRLQHQVLTDDIAFTGCRFFIITRKFVMSVIGTIVTYQACLLQFNSLNQNVKVAIHEDHSQE